MAVNPPYVRFYRWKVHLDWVQQVRYSPELRQLISCSESEKTSLVIGCLEDKTQACQSGKRDSSLSSRTRDAFANMLMPRVRSRLEQTVFSVYKGVKCFGVSKARSYVVTAGMDRNVRIWNPYVPSKPLSTLKSHEAPVVYLSISDEEGKVFTVSLDKCIFVWDLLNHCPLLSCRPRSHRISGDIQACHYSPSSRCLAFATETMNTIQQRFLPIRNNDGLTSHESPIRAVAYSHVYKHLISACELSVVKTWSVAIGSELFQFDASTGGHSITCLALDDACRRLFTGGSDGAIHMWNHNNGELLRTLSPGPQLASEIVDVAYVISNDCRCLVSVGWSKQVTVYLDDTSEFKQQVYPLSHWPDDLAKGHEDDLVSVTFCPCNLLVTSSCDGMIVVWNFVSGHKICSLATPERQDENRIAGRREITKYPIEGRITRNNRGAKKAEDDDDGCSNNNNKINNSGELDEMVPKVKLLMSRCNKPATGNLVSLGFRGHLHFWNVHKSGGRHSGSFKALDKSSHASLVVMAIDSTDRTLVVGDSNGFVCTWDVSRFCLGKKLTDPILLANWRAHTRKLTCLRLVEESCGLCIVTSSIEGCIRIWNDSGHFIGTFSKKGCWLLTNPSTYVHPRVPHDILIHPLSLPTHPLIPSQHMSTEQVIFGEGFDDNDADDDEFEETFGSYSASSRGRFINVKSSHIDNLYNFRKNCSHLEMEEYSHDERRSSLIDKILNNPNFINADGMRLRYERTRPRPLDAGGPTIYAHLKVHDLGPEPTQMPRILKKTKSNESPSFLSMD